MLALSEAYGLVCYCKGTGVFLCAIAPKIALSESWFDHAATACSVSARVDATANCVARLQQASLALRACFAPCGAVWCKREQVWLRRGGSPRWRAVCTFASRLPRRTGRFTRKLQTTLPLLWAWFSFWFRENRPRRSRAVQL